MRPILIFCKGEGNEKEKDEDDSNALDLADPVDILSKMPPDFFELLVSEGQKCGTPRVEGDTNNQN
jgi:hypothetical protein